KKLLYLIISDYALEIKQSGFSVYEQFASLILVYVLSSLIPNYAFNVVLHVVFANMARLII
ncbi:hypothetical protein, partial [Leuconostoc mesenteroides]|uniref:hypothetical protein n=1 Tax=Leuconostoc mesenteroides TaxID=1245 RepID=UPI0025A2003D